MPTVTWIGPSAPAGLLEALQKRQVRLARDARDSVARVIHTASTRRVPRVPAGGRWVWVVRGAVTQEQRTEAILRGAYDVIDLRSATAADDLAARLEELGAPEPAMPSTDTLVAESGVSRA